MMTLHTTVALLEDMPEHKLRRGQVGTVVEILAEDAYEIEFSDNQGKTFAMLPLKAAQLMRLYDEPADEAGE